VRRVVLTGATGFVGASLARRLLRDGHDVHLFVRPGYRSWRIQSIRNDVHLHEVDLTDESSLHAAVSATRPSWVFHLAAHGAYSAQTDVQEMLRTNVIGTVNLVNACIRVGFDAFVNTGSSSEYGYRDGAPSETEALEPNSHYAVTKASATMYCRYTAQSQGVHLPTLRLYSVYGPYEEPGRLMPSLIVRGLSGKFPPLVNPDIARDYVYADDVDEAYIRAASVEGQEPGAVYNVGTGVQTPLRDVVGVARDVLAIDDEPRWGSMPDRAWDTTVWMADNRRIQQVLGWQPYYGFRAGFTKTVDWFKTEAQSLGAYPDLVVKAG
jgi:nucleoside-diphosphate-sugar epimerase